MKSFDLTFNGAILPDHDPGQVKQAFARLFRIDDSALLERIFSGQPIVLRHNLDRKEAADYFRQITLLGGQASLVKSPKYRSVQGDELLVLEAKLARQAEQEPDPEPIPADPPQELPPALPPETPVEPETGQSANDDGVENRLEALDRAREALQEQEARLLRRKAQHDRIAQEEVTKIELLREDNLARFEQEFAGLKALEDAQADTLSARLSGIEKKKSDSEARGRQTVIGLDELVQTTLREEEELANLLTQRLESVHEFSLEEIRQLEQQIEEARVRAQAELAELQQQLDEVRTQSEAERDVLQNQKADTLREMDGELDQLEEEVLEARKLSQSRTTELKQQEQGLRDLEKDEMLKLEAMKADIERRRKQGVADVTQELEHLRVRTAAVLQQLEEAGLDQQNYRSRQEAG